jgi:hypothetical protein
MSTQKRDAAYGCRGETRGLRNIDEHELIQEMTDARSSFWSQNQDQTSRTMDALRA